MRPSTRLVLITTLFCGAIFPASAIDVFFHGKVVDPFGFPIKNATVDYNTVIQATTNDSGEFVITGPAGALPRGAGMQAVSPSLQMRNGRLVIAGINARMIQVIVTDCQGRVRYSALHDGSAAKIAGINLQEKGRWPAGMYLLQVIAGDTRLRAGLLAQGSHLTAQRVSVSAPGARIFAKRQSSITNFTVTASGYAQATYGYDGFADFGMELMLRYPGEAAPDPVTVGSDSEEQYLNVARTFGSRTVNWAGSSVKSYEAATERGMFLTYDMITLDNGLLLLKISPQTGSRVLYAIDKTKGLQRQMFATAASSSAMMCTKFSNLGGLKPSFPYAENSTGAIDPTCGFGYAAGYFVQRHPDGAVSVIMNMRFDYNQREEDVSFLGKYGDRPLITVVTLRPGQTIFDIAYIADNVNPTPRSDRIWNDAIMPFYPDKWIFPTKWAINHCATDLWDIAGNGGIENVPSSTGSYFALYPQYGFAGTYYSGDDASHLRVADPARVPGTKLYVQIPDKVPELWSSTNVLFEAPHALVNAFDPMALPLGYFMTKGMGEVVYANEQVAISLPAADSFALMLPKNGIVSVYNYNETASPLLSEIRVGPDTVLRGTFTTGLRVVSKDGHELCNVVLPLQFTDNQAMYDSVKALATCSGCGSGSMALNPANLDARFRYNYELEEVTARNSGLSALASQLAAANVSASDTADILISMARAAYKTGGFTAVNSYLTALGSSQPEQAKYLRALMDFESGADADFSSTPIEGNYFRALQSIQAGSSSQAITLLDVLIAARPNAVRPRILRAYLKNDFREAIDVFKRVPGSLELWVVLKEMGFPGAEERLAGLLQQSQMATIRAADFVKEIKQGIWRHERRYEYNSTWFEGVAMPEFPDTLKYKDGPAPLGN